MCLDLLLVMISVVPRNVGSEMQACKQALSALASHIDAPQLVSHQSCCLALRELEQQLACSLWSQQCQSSEARSDHLS